MFEIEISHMDKNKRNPDLVSEKNIIFTQQKVKNMSTVHSWRVVGGLGGGFHCTLS